MPAALCAKLVDPLLADTERGSDVLPGRALVVHSGRDEAGQLGIETGGRFGALLAVGANAIERGHRHCTITG